MMTILNWLYFSSSAPKTLHILHNSEHPASCFAILDSGATLVADTLFNGLMSNLKNYYQARKGAKIESKGQRFQLSDFILKIGSVSLAGSMKGILVEVSVEVIHLVVFKVKPIKFKCYSLCLTHY